MSPCLLVKGSLALQPTATLQARSCCNRAEPQRSSEAAFGGALGVQGDLTVHGKVDIKDCQSRTIGGAMYAGGAACKFRFAIHVSAVWPFLFLGIKSV